MNLLDRHIFKNVLLACAGTVALFTFVLVLGNVIRDLLSHVLAGQFPLSTLLRLVWFWVPAMAIYALPMGMLMGVLLTLGRLSADSEITAMRAAGLGLVRIARPIFLLGALGALAALYLNFESMPRARVQYEREFAEALRANPLTFIIPKTFVRAFRGCVLYVGDLQGNVVHDVWLWKLDAQGRAIALERSATGRITYDEADYTLQLALTPAQVETRDRDDPENFTKASVVNVFSVLRPEPIPLRQFFALKAAGTKRDWLTYGQLRAEQARLAALPAPVPDEANARAREKLQASLVLHDKFNLALAVFSFAVVGVPLGIKVSRRETSANLGLALVLVLGYYLLTEMVKWLDQRPELRPDLLLWAPNVLFLGLGAWMLRRIGR